MENNNIKVEANIADELKSEAIAYNADSPTDQGLKKLTESCPMFKKMYDYQQSNGLDENSWFNASLLLCQCGNFESTKAFSKLSSKHDARSDERIEKLIDKHKDYEGPMVRCSTFHCERAQIEKCFNKVNYNDLGEPTNSPGAKLKYYKITPEEKLKESTTILDLVIKAMKEDDKRAYLGDESIKTLKYLEHQHYADFLIYRNEIRKLSGLGKLDFKNTLKKYMQLLAEKELKEKIKDDYEEAIRAGFYYSERHDCLKGPNPSKFAKHGVEKYQFLLRDSQDFYIYENNVYKYLTEIQVKKRMQQLLHSYVPDVWEIKVEREYFSALYYEARSADVLKEPKGLINVKNGLLDTKTYTLIPHSDEYFTTSQANVSYNEDAKCPKFIQFLFDIFSGDENLVKLVQEMMGYCLTIETRGEKFFILRGAGSNGKSLLCEIISELVGKDNVSNVSLNRLSKQFGTYSLVDKLVNLSTETEIQGGINTEELKAIVSGDPLSHEPKGRNPFSSKLNATMIFATNNMPYSKDKSYGFERRMVIIPFDRKFSHNPKNNREGKIDVYLKDKLLEELDGIFNFAVEGLKRLVENDYVFTEAEKAVEELEEYKLEINPYLEFVEEKLEVMDIEGPEVQSGHITRIGYNDLFARFKTWATARNHSGYSNASINTFYRQLKSVLKEKDMPFIKVKSSSEQYIAGLQFTSDTANKELVRWVKCKYKAGSKTDKAIEEYFGDLYS